MNDRVNELIAQLKRISPLPEDDLLTEEILKQYEKIITELEEFKDPRSIQPLIESFGYGDGYEVYGTVVYLLECFGFEQIESYLLRALEQGKLGSKYWATQILGRNMSKQAIPQLKKLMETPHDFLRVEAIRAMYFIDQEFIKNILENLKDDPSPGVKVLIKWIIDDLKIY